MDSLRFTSSFPTCKLLVSCTISLIKIEYKVGDKSSFCFTPVFYNQTYQWVAIICTHHSEL